MIQDAIRIADSMISKWNIYPSTYACNLLLSACSRQKSIVRGRHIQNFMEGAVKYDVVTCNTLIRLYSQCGSFQEAILIFNKMTSSKISPNERTYSIMLTGCAKACDLEEGRRIHKHMVSSKANKNVAVMNALIQMYFACGSLQEAVTVLDSMMLEGIEPDQQSFTIALTGCADQKAYKDGVRIHRKMIDNGMEHNVITFSTLIRFYAECNQLEEAITVFKSMISHGISPNTHTYTILINACAEKGELMFGSDVYEHMLQSRVKQNIFTVNAMIRLYAESFYLGEAIKLFESMEEKGITPNIHTYTVIISGATIANEVQIGKQFYEQMISKMKPDLIAITTLLRMFCECGHISDAMNVFNGMKSLNISPSDNTYAIILTGCADAKALTEGRKVHEHMIASKFVKNRVVTNALIKMYSKCGCIDDAMNIFNNMGSEGLVPDDYTYSIILSGCAETRALASGKHVERHMAISGFKHTLKSMTSLIHMYAKCARIREAMEVFELAKEQGIIPDDNTYTVLLYACADAREHELGVYLHRQMTESGKVYDLRSTNALLNMYVKCMRLTHAKELFENMQERDIYTWSIMILAYGLHGLGNEALHLFYTMQQEGLIPNESIMVAVLTACSRSFKVDVAYDIYFTMEKKYGIVPAEKIQNCMVDALARSGNIQKAKEFINTMKNPSVITWIIVLGACRTFGDVEEGQEAAEKIFALNPYETAPYILLANIYAEAVLHTESAKVRERMN
jgi:pentatricopeptide repeat protein